MAGERLTRFIKDSAELASFVLAPYAGVPNASKNPNYDIPEQGYVQPASPEYAHEISRALRNEPPVVKNTSDQEPEEFTGFLTVIYGDGQSGEKSEAFWLNSPDGKTKVQLVVGEEQKADAMGMNGKKVSGKGLAGDKIVVQKVKTLDEPESIQTDSPQELGSQPTVSVLCKFNDINREPVKPSFIDELFADTEPGLDHFQRQLSGDMTDLSGSERRGWYTLPRNHSEYIKPDGYPDWDLLVRDCTSLADPTTDFRVFKALNLIFNDTLGCCAWGGKTMQTLDGETRVWPVAWIPDWAIQQGLEAHELIGHAISSWPHVYEYDGREYSTSLDFMSSPMVCVNPDRRLGCIARNTTIVNKDSAGWISADRKLVVGIGSSAYTTVEQSLLAPPSGVVEIEIPVPGSSPTKTLHVEARKPVGYDVYGFGVVVTEAESGRWQHYYIMQPGEGTVLTTGEKFSYLGVNIGVCKSTPTGYSVAVGNQTNALDCDVTGGNNKVFIPLVIK